MALNHRDHLVDAAADQLRQTAARDWPAVRLAYLRALDDDAGLRVGDSPDGSQGHPGDRDEPDHPAAGNFRALMPGETIGATLYKVAVFKVGRWNGQAYRPDDLASMVAAFAADHYEIPLTLGHDASASAPAVGRVSRLWIEKDTLYADFINVDPAVIEGIRAGRWLAVSCETFLGMDRASLKYKAALRAVAILGAHPPGVDLPPLRDAKITEAAP